MRTAHVLDRIRSATLVSEPFPYFYVENVFQEADYEGILKSIPQDEPGKQKTRRVIPFEAGLDSQEFLDGVVGFFNLPHGPLRAETRLCLDRENYGIGPHTDIPSKLVSLLFYLAPDNENEDIGTSIYAPNDPDFKCNGGLHYRTEGFEKLWTAPFRRNSLLGFWKTDKGFHGVEKIRRPTVRNVLLYNVYHA